MIGLYHISQTENNDYGTYDSAVVCAVSEEAARRIHPAPTMEPERTWWLEGLYYPTWATRLENVKVRLIGTALDDAQPGVVCSSFNAG